MASDSVSFFQELFKSFPVLKNQVVQSVSPISHGHINKSLKIRVDDQLYFVQQINHQIFKDVKKLSDQIDQVAKKLSSFYKQSLLPYESLTFFETTDQNYFKEVNGAFYRVSEFKDHLQTFQLPVRREMVISAAEAFAFFVKGLEGLPVADAFVPISRFHDLDYRYQQLQSAAAGFNGKHAETESLIAKAEGLFRLLKPMVMAISEGVIPLRWVHNDTKLNNLLFDKELNATCVIDLDTVMPGTILYDLGDALRTIGSNLPEDYPDIDSLRVNRDYLSAFTNTYLETLQGTLTKEELQLVPYSATYMSAIMGVRFLTDHLNGDKYFNVAFRGQNLDRAKNQLCLAEEFNEIRQNRAGK